MEHKIKKHKVAIIGPYPPPYGGISVFIKRFLTVLNEKGIEYKFFDSSSIELRKIFWELIFEKCSIVHLHTLSIKSRSILCLYRLFNKRVILTIHGASLYDQLKEMNIGKKILYKKLLHQINKIIVVNPDIKENLLKEGFSEKQISVIPSFIPPAIREEEIAEIPQEVWGFIDSHSPIISANAYRISFYNGQDLYGIDMCIDLCANLKKTYPQIGFVFCLPDIGDRHYFNKMKQKVVEKDIKNNFLFMTKPCQFYPILMKSDLFVRPTNTDGDAVSLREALYFKVPSIASDVVPRPQGTILFKDRDIDDFILKVKEMLSNYDEHKERVERAELEDNIGKILNLYQEVSK